MHVMTPEGEMVEVTVEGRIDSVSIQSIPKDTVVELVGRDA